jgi:putative Mg2+ transporter-C (MgtC) family protein
VTIVQAALGLVVAAVLGAAVGFQRQYTQKPAGIRTHALVALGACAFAEYSALLGDTRIAASVITGIGFLGAGAIVRHGFTTRGLTTAASIWTASAIAWPSVWEAVLGRCCSCRSRCSPSCC